MNEFAGRFDIATTARMGITFFEGDSNTGDLKDVERGIEEGEATRGIMDGDAGRIDGDERAEN